MILERQWISVLLPRRIPIRRIKRNPRVNPRIILKNGRSTLRINTTIKDRITRRILLLSPILVSVNNRSSSLLRRIVLNKFSHFHSLLQIIRRIVRWIRRSLINS